MVGMIWGAALALLPQAGRGSSVLPPETLPKGRAEWQEPPSSSGVPEMSAAHVALRSFLWALQMLKCTCPSLPSLLSPAPTPTQWASEQKNEVTNSGWISRWESGKTSLREMNTEHNPSIHWRGSQPLAGSTTHHQELCHHACQVSLTHTTESSRTLPNLCLYLSFLTVLQK